MLHQFTSRQFLKFLCTGGIAAIINFSSRFLYNIWFSFATAIILAYVTGMITAFILAKLFVFKNSPLSLRHSAFRFLLINLLAVLQTLLISLGLAFYLLPALGVTVMVKEIAHAIGIIVPIFSSYIGHKHWSFSEKKSCSS
jgi:putative flippase GtrA